jgi:hypothetical protein
MSNAQSFAARGVCFGLHSCSGSGREWLALRADARTEDIPASLARSPTVP